MNVDPPALRLVGSPVVAADRPRPPPAEPTSGVAREDAPPRRWEEELERRWPLVWAIFRKRVRGRGEEPRHRRRRRVD